MALHTSRLKLIVNQSPEVLERILRVARHRGFEVKLMHWSSEHGELELTVSSQRAIHLLTSQLEKLFDVKQVTDLNEQINAKSA